MNTLLYSNRVNLPYPVKANQNILPLGYQRMLSSVFTKPRIIPITQVNDSPVIENKTPNKMLWGEPTWFLLHTLAYKIKEDVFAENKNEILRIIYVICTNLPCPTCSDHAKTYLDGINMRSIQTKEQLKQMLFHFHNEVNKMKGYKPFLYDDCEAKYSNAVTTNIIQNFMPFFADRSRSPKLMASDFQKTYIVKMLKEWFQKNIGIFHP
jgi:hypothetical protein